MNSFEKQRLAYDATVSAMEKAGKNFEIIKDGQFNKVRIDGTPYDVNGNFTHYWILVLVSRNRILVWQESPGKYRFFKVPARQMYKLAHIIEAQNILDGKVEINDEENKMKWNTRDPNKEFERLVINSEDEKIIRYLEKFEMFVDN